MPFPWVRGRGPPRKGKEGRTASNNGPKGPFFVKQGGGGGEKENAFSSGGRLKRTFWGERNSIGNKGKEKKKKKGGPRAGLSEEERGVKGGVN